MTISEFLTKAGRRINKIDKGHMFFSKTRK